MTTALDLLKAKRTTLGAQREETKAKAQLEQEQKERFFHPVREIVEELLAAESPIVFFTANYLYGREKPLRKSMFGPADKMSPLPPFKETTRYGLTVGHDELYSISVDSTAGLKFVSVRTHQNGIATKTDRREFATHQDAISDLLDVIAEWSVAEE